MDIRVTIWIMTAAVAANLPFFSRRFLLFIPLKKNSKSVSACLAELVFWGVVCRAVGIYFERQLGQVVPQGWMFYVIFALLFVTLAFPGFVFRYLLRSAK